MGLYGSPLKIVASALTLFNNKQISTGDNARVMSLRQPEKKMSKSDSNAQATIELTDSADVIRSKIRKAVTDSHPFISYDIKNY